MVDRHIGKYRILGSLGAGGMGEVLLAEDPELLRQVALKTLPAEAAVDPQRVAMLRREARTVAALNHPNIVTLFTVEAAETENGAVIFLTMERVEGQTLRELIPPEGFDLDNFRRLAEPLVAAVAAAHARGVTHRDLKPANVMVSTEGRLKVLDFGLATVRSVAVDEDSVATVTTDNTITGTIPYMAPEQLQGLVADHRSDVFALGLLLYEMLTGRRPFPGNTVSDVISAVLRDEPVPLSRQKPVPPALDQLVHRCLEKDPILRFQTAEDLLVALAEPAMADAAVADIAGPDRERPLSVAVTDFENITGDAEVDWLATGIAETVTVDLKKLSSLKVVGRDQVIRELGVDAAARVARADLAGAGARLGIAWIVGGGFQRVGERIRITAWFVDVEKGEIAGSVKADGTLDEIFDLQDRILDGLTKSLQLQISDTDRRKLARDETPRVEAYECYARGRQLVYRMSRTSIDEARRHFEQAIELDNRYALAYSGLGSLHMMRFIASTDPADLSVGISYLERAVELDPDLSDPHQWLCYGLARQHRFPAAIASGERAIALEPDNPFAHYFLGTALWIRGLFDYEPGAWMRAARVLRRVTELAPRYQPGFMILGTVYLYLGRYEEAGRVLNHAAEIERSGNFQMTRFIGAFSLLGRLRLRQGDLEAAREAFETALELLEDIEHVYAAACRAMAFVGIGDVHMREGRPDDALSSYRRATASATVSDRSLGVGWLVIRARIGEARAFRQLGMKREGDAALSAALELHALRTGFDFSGIWEGGPLQIEFDLAQYHALDARTDEAIKHLSRAVAAGWHDVRFAESDPDLESLRESPQFEAIVAEMTGQVSS